MNMETQQPRSVLCEIVGGVARVTLNRPERHNAFDETVMEEFGRILDAVAVNDDARAVVLAGAGKSFSAGADLEWMRRSASYSEEENEAEAQRLADLLYRLDTFPKPTLARIHGNAFGAGIGIIAACDIAIAAIGTRFAFSEVRLGLIPAVIAPYVLRGMGARAARRYMLTGERFSAEEACRLELVTDLVPEDLLNGCCNEIVRSLVACGPRAVEATKELIAVVSDRPNDAGLRRDTARRIARIRAGDEAREGIEAFFARRHPAWAGRA